MFLTHCDTCRLVSVSWTRVTRKNDLPAERHGPYQVLDGQVDPEDAHFPPVVRCVLNTLIATDRGEPPSRIESHRAILGLHAVVESAADLETDLRIRVRPIV